MLTLFSLVLTVCLVLSARRHRPSRRTFIGEAEAIVVHGPNKWNNKPVIDYTGILRNPILRFGLHEVDALNMTGNMEEKITEATDTSRMAATTRDLSALAGRKGSDPLTNWLPPVPPLNQFPGTLNDYFNIKLEDVPTFYLGSAHQFDRRPMVEYDEYMRRGEVFRAKGSQTHITIADWNRASGYLKVKQFRRSGLYELRLEICALKNSLYTVWEAGVLNANTDNEQQFGSPAGGIPNIIVTDMYGYGKLEWTQKWNPFECSQGEDCTVQYSLQYHMDGSVYGGAPAMGGQGLLAGTISSNHLYVPTFGKIVQPAQHRFTGPHCFYDAWGLD